MSKSRGFFHLVWTNPEEFWGMLSPFVIDVTGNRSRPKDQPNC